MIFVGYEPGSKGYQFWDAAHQQFKIFCDVKFEESQFSAKELKMVKEPIQAPLSDLPISQSDDESDTSGLDLVNLDQSPTMPPTHGQPTPQQSVILPLQSPSCQPLAPPLAASGSQQQPQIPVLHYQL